MSETTRPTGQKKRLLLSILSSFVAVMCSYGINLVLTPFITETLGVEANGFVTLAKNFVTYATVLATALNSYAVRFISVAYGEGDKARANTLFSTVFYANVILGLAILLVMVLFIGVMDRVLNVPAALLTDVRVLFILVFLNMYCTMLNTAYSAAGYIANRLDVVGLCKTVSYIAEAGLLLLLYTSRAPFVWYVGVCMLVHSGIVLVSNVLIKRRCTPDLTLDRRRFSWTETLRILGAGVWNSLNSLGNMLNSGLDLLVTNIALSAAAMGQLSIARTITSVVGSLLAMLAQPFQPLFLRRFAQKDERGLKDVLRLSAEVSGLVGALVFAVFFVLGESFYRLWTPSQDAAMLWRLTVISLLSYIPESAVFPLYYIYTLKIRNRVPALNTIVGGLVNVGAKYLLLNCTDLGVYAIVWTTTVVMSVISCVTNPLYMARCMGEKWHFCLPVILRQLLSAGLLTGLSVLLMRVLPSADSWLTFLLDAAVLSVAGCAVHFAVVSTGRLTKALRRERRPA